MSLGDHSPKIGNGTWIAPHATVIGDVRIGDNCQIWYDSILRGLYNINFLRSK